MANTRCHSVIVLDVSSLSPITDFLILGTGTSGRQMRSVADEIVELGETAGFKPYRIDGYESSNWVAIDCVDVVIHVFNDEARRYYDLESLWGDAPRVNWE